MYAAQEGGKTHAYIPPNTQEKPPAHRRASLSVFCLGPARPLSHLEAAKLQACGGGDVRDNGFLPSCCRCQSLWRPAEQNMSPRAF